MPLSPCCRIGKSILTMRRFMLGCALTMVIAATSSRADAEFFQSRDYGTLVPEGTQIDADHDGKMADLVLLNGTSNELGDTTTQGALEWPEALTSTTCPNGNPGFQGQLVKGSAVTHVVNGDSLLITFRTGTTCVDSTTHTASLKLDGVVVGGTGRFVNAKGAVQINGIVVAEVAIDEAGVALLGDVDLRTTGTVSTQSQESKNDVFAP